MMTALMLAGCATKQASDVATLTRPLPATAWDVSVWLSAADAPVMNKTVRGADERAADGASWFVSTLENEQKVVRATWMTAGLGVYELYVNGRMVGDEVLKPGFTHYQKTKRAFTYDITPLMQTAQGNANTLAVQVTPGWWADKIVTYARSQGFAGKKCAFRGVLQLTFADGTTKQYGTDTLHWRAGIAGPVKHAAIFDGEEYDARVPQGFLTPERLNVPEVNTEFKGEILPTDGAEVYLRRDLTLHPIEAYTWREVTGAVAGQYGTVAKNKTFAPGQEMTLVPGETLVVDFGQNAAAVPAFTFRAAEGTVLTCLPGEILNDGNGARSRRMDGPEGSVHRENLRMHEHGIRMVYTFGKGNAFVDYMPRYTFFGYRYISVSATDTVVIRKVESVPVSSIAQNMETGTITTGDASVNQLISNTLWGQRSNYLSVPTDCPQRNERLGWTADTQVFCETGTYFADTDRFFHKWMRDMRDTQSLQGAFPGVAPLAQYGANKTEMMRLGWADAGVIVPWTVWKQFGDKAIVDENWAAMEQFMGHVNATKYDHDALRAENGDFQWADWLSYEPLESCTKLHIDKNTQQVLPEARTYWSYLGASYWAIDAAMMIDMARATGRETAKYENMLAEAKDYLRQRFMNDDGTFKTPVLNTMQTPALFALKNNLLSGQAREDMIARLKQNFAEHGNCLQTGFLGTSILMQTLTDNGMADIAYNLLFQRNNPSWLYSVDNGATTIWERWNSYMKDKGMGPRGMNSFNHYAYGCVCQWLWQTAAGIAADTGNPGFRHIIMRPVPDRRLGHLDATYRSAAGTVRSAWKYEGDTWHWTFTIPRGATATVTLPGQTGSKTYKAGTHKVKLKL